VPPMPPVSYAYAAAIDLFNSDAFVFN